MKASELALLDPNAEILAVRINGQVRVLSPVVTQVTRTSDYYDVRENRNHNPTVSDLGKQIQDIESTPGWNKWG